MEVVKFVGRVRRSEFLVKPVWFSQSQEFNESRKIQLNNRKIDVEYVYDIDIVVNRRITEQEKTQMQNAINSIIMCHGDMSRKGIFIWERLLHLETMIEFMQGGDVEMHSMQKRYLLANGNDIGFVSDYEDLISPKAKIIEL